jgi:cation:H+ antiporter
MQTAKPDSRQQILFMSLALAATLPGVYLRVTGIHPEPILAAILYGMAIVGAAFILSWAAEVIQLDIASGLALALLALIAPRRGESSPKPERQRRTALWRWPT